ncbi:MAG: AAA family ATPase [Burkholderiaceae bacterium]|nr:AAA family ATPase [Burkholderiaceae bacterium]
MNAVRTLADHATLVRALAAQLAAERVIETHISSVLLAGERAYKLKKPLAFGFLDFSTLALREHFCREELRINRRTAPQLYLEVLSVTGTVDAPQLGGAGRPVEWLLSMRRFDPACTLDQLAAHGALDGHAIDALAQAVAALHAQAARAPGDGRFGTPATVRRWADDNLAELRAASQSAADRARLDALAQWTARTLSQQAQCIAARLRDGFVRECHGDLHLANAVMIDGRPQLFDALEFNEELRWIDVVSDIAFLFMDLLDHDAAPLAWRVLNAWVDISGDWAGLARLRGDAVYRALVRAKVALLRTQQPQVLRHTRLRAQRDFGSYLRLAESLAQPPAPQLVVMTGLSGSGKSRVAAELAMALGALRVRSDVERKRLAGLAATARGAASLYAADMTARTYAQLGRIAGELLDAGLSVVIDAASLRADERRALAQVARARGCAADVVACEAPAAELARRIAARAQRGGDPSDATPALLLQQQRWRALRAADEPAHHVIDTDCSPDALRARCASLAMALRRAG